MTGHGSPASEGKLAAWLRAADVASVPRPQFPKDWVALLQEARRANMAGILLEQVRNLGISIPLEIENSLRAAALAVAARQLHWRRELEPTLAVLNAADVPVMLLKGAALNLTLYSRSDLRPLSDLDLLVPAEQAVAAREALIGAGCRPGFDLVRPDFFPRYYYESELFSAGVHAVRLDLHARPFRPLRLAITVPQAAFWANAQAVNVGKATAFVPCTETMWIHLAVHAALHDCARLIWLYDLVRFAKHHRECIDWDRVVGLCRQWRVSRVAWTAVRRAKEQFGSVVPSEVEAALAAHPCHWRDRWSLANAARSARSPIRSVLVEAATTPCWRTAMGYLAAYALPGRAHLAGFCTRRFPGWTLVAHARRALRTIGRLPCALGGRL